MLSGGVPKSNKKEGFWRLILSYVSFKVMNKADADRVKTRIKIADQLFRLAFEIKRNKILSKYPDLSIREANHRAYALIEKGCS